MANELSTSAQKVQRTLEKRGFSFKVKELPSSTRTAKEAARTIGCTVPQIAKSLVFKGEKTGKPILVIASGSNRVDTLKLSKLVGESVGKADADFVRRHTGFAIGGVPPVGHSEPIPTIIDEDLLKYDEIWAAAGTPNAVFKLQPSEIVDLTEGMVEDIKQYIKD